jgi:hypothetical protein
MRWTIIHGDGRQYLCPAERYDEARRMLDRLDEYWERHERGAPIPPEPDFLIRFEGERLTFTDPLLNGRTP